MNNKAKTVAVSAVCAAVATVCLVLAGLPVFKWVVLIFAAIASVAVAVPIIIDCRNLPFSVIAYLVSGALGVFFGLANVVYVAPIVAFCMPMSIVKAYGESMKVTASVQESQVLEDPFGQGDDRKVVAVKLDGKRCLPVWLKWLLYYVLLEAGVALTLLAAYLFTRPVFDMIFANNLVWVLVGAMQVVVFPFDLLLRGCFVGIVKILHKTHIN